MVARVLESLTELSKILYHGLLLIEAAIEMFLENSYSFYDKQIIGVPKIKMSNVDHCDFGKAKQW